MVAVNVNDIFAYLRELESKYPINGLQSEDDLQEKIDELEIKLMRFNAVKEELEKQIEDPQMVAVNVNDIFAYLRELESKYPINGLQSENDLQVKIDELEIKLMRLMQLKKNWRSKLKILRWLLLMLMIS